MAKPKALAKLEESNICKDAGLLRTEVKGDCNIHGTKYFQGAIFYQIL